MRRSKEHFSAAAFFRDARPGGRQRVTTANLRAKS
jgi:hypothetical protein